MHQAYILKILTALPELNIDKIGDLRLEVWFGVSQTHIDTDNLVKVFKDTISKKYDFPDQLICHEHVHKVRVFKGGEFIAFDLSKTDTYDWTRQQDMEYKEIERSDRYWNRKLLRNNNQVEIDFNNEE